MQLVFMLVLTQLIYNRRRGEVQLFFGDRILLLIGPFVFDVITMSLGHSKSLTSSDVEDLC